MDPDTAESIRYFKRARTLINLILAIISVSLRHHYKEDPRQVDGFGPVNPSYCTVVAWFGLLLTVLGAAALCYFSYYCIYLLEAQHRLPQHYWLSLLLFGSGVLWNLQYVNPTPPLQRRCCNV